MSPPERLLFARLSVFVTSWTLEAAEAVCSGQGIEVDDVLDLVLHLVDKSLVVAEDESEVIQRYHLVPLDEAEPDVLAYLAFPAEH